MSVAMVSLSMFTFSVINSSGESFMKKYEELFNEPIPLSIWTLVSQGITCSSHPDPGIPTCATPHYKGLTCRQCNKPSWNNQCSSSPATCLSTSCHTDHERS